MGATTGIVLIVLGGLCLPSLVAQKSPKAKEMLDKIVPYQGWIGFIAFAWGTWGIISSLLSLGIIGLWPLAWTTNLVASLLNFAGGLILGFGMIQKFTLAKAPAEAQEKAAKLREKLVGMQPKIGITSLAVGVWVILYSFVFRSMLLI